MNTFTKPFLVSILMLLSLTAFKGVAQIVYEPSYRTVNGFLYRLAQKGVIELNDVVLPLPRKYILEKLEELSTQSQNLTALEKEELAFYLKDYTIEKNLVDNVDLTKPYKSVFKELKGDRFRFAAYQDNQFAINVQPTLGFVKESIGSDGTSISHSWKGAWSYGYLGKHTGFSFDFSDNVESGQDIDKVKAFEPSTGIILSNTGTNSFNNSQIRGTIATDWKWGVFTVGKDFMPIGYGIGGKLILSQRAPSFPLVRLDIKPTKWFNFNYAHIWLNSKMIDSTTIRPSGIPLAKYDYFSFIEKFLVTHSLVFTPFKGATLTIGENVIYSGRLKMVYFIPVMFFNALDHYLGGYGGTNTISNSQLFFQLSLRNHIPKTHLYFTFLADEIRTKDFFSSGPTRNQTGYTAGATIADFPVDNVSLSLEYSRIRPFTYENFEPSQAYQSNNYTLGHWIGSNADQLYIDALWRIIRGLHLKGSLSYVRKGDRGTALEQQTVVGRPFLYGNVNTYTDVDFSLNYEIKHDLFFKAVYHSRKVLNQKSDQTTFDRNSISFGFNYGF